MLLFILWCWGWNPEPQARRSHHQAPTCLVSIRVQPYSPTDPELTLESQAARTSTWNFFSFLACWTQLCPNMPPAARQLSLGHLIRNLQTQTGWHAFGETTSWMQNWTDPSKHSRPTSRVSPTPFLLPAVKQGRLGEVKVGSFSCMDHPGLW